MDKIQKLQDPQLVADFQHFFGVHRKDVSGSKKEYIQRGQWSTSAPGSQSRGWKSKLMDRYLDEQSSKKDLYYRSKCEMLTVPEPAHKTHTRQDSAASNTSVASDVSSGNGKTSYVTFNVDFPHI